MSYPTYLIHYNKNHSKANGQFVSGDGDGDGVANDHKNQKKELTSAEKKAKERAQLKRTRKKIINQQKQYLKDNSPVEQFKKLPKKEKKARVKAGIIITAASLATAAAVGAAYCISERNEKIRNEQNQQRAREWVEKVNQIKWSEAASKAKNIGGDW